MLKATALNMNTNPKTVLSHIKSFMLDKNTVCVHCVQHALFLKIIFH